MENVDYDRLEVSSPGLIVLSRREADFVRFLGFEVELQLKVVFQGRKVQGILQRAEAAEQRLAAAFRGRQGRAGARLHAWMVREAHAGAQW